MAVYENTFENVVCKMASISSQLQCVQKSYGAKPLAEVLLTWFQKVHIQVIMC